MIPARGKEAVGISFCHVLGVLCDILCVGEILQENDSIKREGASA